MTVSALRPGEEVTGCVYTSSSSGHRPSYAAVISRLFALETVVDEPGLAVFRKLCAARRVFFVTIDDNLAFYALVAMSRALLSRPTSGLFLKPVDVVAPKSAWNKLKRMIVRATGSLPKTSLITIQPFEFAPEFATVATHGVFDPQMWDMHDGARLKEPAATPLSRQVEQQARGRPVISVIGPPSIAKGFPFFVDMLVRDQRLPEQFLFVSAGKVPKESEASVRTFESLGGVCVDRWLTDAEIESLYTVSSAIWSCYAPGYDQASGIFGRAVQFGRQAVVREGSWVARMARRLQLGTIELDMSDPARSADVLLQALSPNAAGVRTRIDHSAIVGGWRREFIATVESTL